MPLNTTALHNGLLDLFQDPGPDIASCADAWGSAVEDCCTSIVPPSTTVAAAAATLKGALAGAFGTDYPASITAMESAFLAFGVTIAAGMLPTYTGVPPAGPVGFADLVGTTRDTYEEAATDLTSMITTWLQTGSATLVAPPNTVVPWI